MRVRKDGYQIDVIGFGMADKLKEINTALRENQYRLRARRKCLEQQPSATGQPAGYQGQRLMRIIAGILRGHRLRCKPGGGLRPTGERMRESLFSALGALVEEAAVCDLFAGSGALGFESVSRGAGHVTFVENKRKLADIIAATAEEWEVADRCRVVSADALTYLGTLDGNPFDIVFADPPFTSDLARRVFGWWVANPVQECNAGAGTSRRLIGAGHGSSC